MSFLVVLGALLRVSQYLVSGDHFLELVDIGCIGVIGMVHLRRVPVRFFQHLAVASRTDLQQGVEIDEFLTAIHRLNLLKLCTIDTIARD